MRRLRDFIYKASNSQRGSYTKYRSNHGTSSNPLHLPSFTRFERHSWRLKESSHEAVSSLNSVHQINRPLRTPGDSFLDRLWALEQRSVVPEQATRVSLETLLIPYSFADLEAPTHPPPLILSTYSQTCNALGRVVAGHLRTPFRTSPIYSRSTYL